MHTHIYADTNTHKQHGVVVVWPPGRQGTAAVCERCEILLIHPLYDLRTDQGRPSYGWRHVGISDNSRINRRAKMEGRNSYGGLVYVLR